jgi:transcriptional regulator with PAS, ATPase and Fis domain
MHDFYSKEDYWGRKGRKHFRKSDAPADELGESPIDYIVYKSDVMRKVMERAKLVAKSDATVLLLGESGTGKELVAKFIHQASPRNEGPFIRINCSAIPENLLESEFFGYEAGSFTGGSGTGKKGLLEYAHNGTVLLDEIGDMPYHMQAKILRALQEKEIMRIGGSKSIKLNVRFIASTNANIPDLIKEKKFRSDLYYRISTASVRLPPLRDRKEDIPLLIDYFLKEFNQMYHTHKSAEKSLTDKLMGLTMPGNIRELRNIVESLVIMTPVNALGADELLKLHPDHDEPIECNGRNYTDDFEGKSLLEIMEGYEKHVLAYFKKRYGKKSDIAAALKVYPSTITRKLQQYNLC